MFVSLCFFFFKQKTAYEMRISDWSSDVCSSDLFHLWSWLSLQLIAGDEHPQADRRRQRKETETPQQAVDDRHVGVAEKAIAETVDHVEERIEVARLEPDRRQVVHRVEHTGQNRSRRDEEIGERR